MKKTGKALSLVLSLALVASSIPAALASAASAVTMTQDGVPEYAVVYASANANAAKGEVALSTLFTGQKVTIQEDKSKVDVTDNGDGKLFDFSKASFSATSNGSIVKLNPAAATATGDVTSNLPNGGTDGKINATAVAKIEGAGAGTVEATVTASNVQINTDKNLEVSKHNNTDEIKTGTVNLSVNLKIYNDGVEVVAADAAAPADGKLLTQSASVGMNEVPTFHAYTLAADTSALAKYTVDTGAALKLTGAAITGTCATGVLTVDAQKTTSEPTSTITSQVYVEDSTKPGTQKANTIAAGLTVNTYYTLAAAEKTSVSRVYGTPTKTLLSGYDVTNRAIHVPSGVTLTVSGEDASVGTITVAGGTVAVTSGSIGAITGTGTVNVGTAFDTNSGNITIGDVTLLPTDTVTITGSTQANDDKTFSSVKVGNITAGTVAITTTQSPADKSAQGQVTVGNVVASTAANVTTSADVKTLTAGSFSGVQAEYADCPYTALFDLKAGVLSTGDLQYFQKVTVGDVAVASLTAGNVNTGTYADHTITVPTTYGYNVDSTTADAASTIAIANNSSMNVASLTVGKIPAAGNSGSITVPAGKLTLADSTDSTTEAANTGITLYVPNATTGTVLYTSNKKASNVFSIPGIDTIASTPNANNVYSYSASKTSFIGFQMNQKVVSLGNGASTTLTTTNLPAGALPTGVTLKWESDKKTVTLAPSADTTSCVVTSTGYTDANVNGGNNVTVTATLVKDGAAYLPAASSDKAVGTCSITLTPTVAPTLTTKVTDLDGNTTVVTPDTVIPMQQSTQYRVQFNADIAGISNINYVTGNDKVAQTGTVSAWNGTSGTYTIYTNGAVGGKVGVYANGAKIFQVEVTDRPFTCDTTVDFAMKAGKTYTFKITPKTGTKINTFTFLTGKDSALSTWGCKLNADGTATATVKAVSAGTYGVYATINGKNYKVFAITVQ